MGNWRNIVKDTFYETGRVDKKLAEKERVQGELTKLFGQGLDLATKWQERTNTRAELKTFGEDQGLTYDKKSNTFYGESGDNKFQIKSSDLIAMRDRMKFDPDKKLSDFYLGSDDKIASHYKSEGMPEYKSLKDSDTYKAGSGFVKGVGSGLLDLVTGFEKGMIGGKGESWESRTKSSFIPGVADAGYQIGKGLITAGKETATGIATEGKDIATDIVKGGSDIVTDIGKGVGKAGKSAVDYGAWTLGTLMNKGANLGNVVKSDTKEVSNDDKMRFYNRIGGSPTDIMMRYYRNPKYAEWAKKNDPDMYKHYQENLADPSSFLNEEIKFYESMVPGATYDNITKQMIKDPDGNPVSALSKVINGNPPFTTTEQDSTFSPAMINTED
tara:strand:+ start:257 stop:1411 length:1155 start_codon:yes stop_codon:yes gene_type:complete